MALQALRFHIFIYDIKHISHSNLLFCELFYNYKNGRRGFVVFFSLSFGVSLMETDDADKPEYVLTGRKRINDSFFFIHRSFGV